MEFFERGLRHRQGRQDVCYPVGVRVWAGCLFAVLSIGSASAFSFGQPGGAVLRAVVQKSDFPSRTVTLSIGSAVKGDGAEVFFGTPLVREVQVPYDVPISWQGSPERWLSLHEVRSGQPVVIVAGDDLDKVVARRLFIHAADPLKPAGGFVAAPMGSVVEADKVCMDPVRVPMVFPVAGRTRWSDTFLASRGGGSRRHKGQDLMAPRLTPLVATFDGTVEFGTGKGNAGNTITVVGDCGWTAEYYHVNNDSPGTDDGKGTADYAFAAGMRSGDRVYAGQLLGWVGDSGNAEGTAPHCHFEIWSQETGACYNATPSLEGAKRISSPVVHVAVPDLPLKRGQSRLDGVVRQIDLPRSVVVLDLVSTQAKQGENVSVAAPTRRFIRVGKDSALRISGVDQPVPLSALLVGDRLTVVGGEAASGQAIPLHEAYAMRLPRESVGLLPNVAPPVDTEPKSEPIVRISLSGPQDEFSRSLSDAVLGPINEFRTAKGLRPMAFDPDLGEAAQEWSVQMMDGDFFDTKAPDGTPMLGKVVAGSSGMVSSSRSARAVGTALVGAFADVFANPEFDRIGVGHGYLDYDPGRVRVQHYWSILVGRSSAKGSR